MQETTENISGLQTVRDTADQTPLEALLQVGEDGRVSSKSVYAFLELLPKHYSRWCKRNIVDNDFAEENVDFVALPMSGERDSFNPFSTIDYRLSVPFAEKLCMLARSERGEQARNYFIQVEKTLKNVAHALPRLSPSELILQLAQDNVRLEHEIHEVRDEVRGISGKFDTAIKVLTTPNVNWKDSMEIAIRKLIGNGGKFDMIKFKGRLYTELEVIASCDLDRRQSRLRNRMKKQGATYAERSAVTKLDVISKDKQLRAIFESLVKKEQAACVASE